MAVLPVSAYYYSEEEKKRILDNIDPIAETASYIFGTADTSRIPFLKQHGILIDFHQDPSKEAPGLPRNLCTPSRGTRSVQLCSVTEVDEPVPAHTVFYVIRLIGPMLDAWKKELNSKEVEIREYLQHAIYKVKTLHPDRLDNLEFIKEYRPFGVTDKEFVMQKSVAREIDPFAPETQVVGLYDIRLHEDARLPPFIKLLEEHKIPVLERSRDKIRVRLTSMEELIFIGKQEAVYGIEEYVRPVLHNDMAREVLHIDVEEETAYDWDEQLSGADEIVGVADTGIDGGHPDLKDRILKAVPWGRPGDTSDPNGHGTHVAGSIAGNGTASEGKIKGMAPEASLFFQSLLDDEGGIGGIPHDLRDLFQEAYDAGVRIHNNSWGTATESEYRFNSLEVDEFVHTHRDMLFVISAGNEGTAFRPRNGQPGFVDWLSLGSPATAKNALTVGASRSIRGNGGFSGLTYGMAWPDKYPEDPIKSALISGDAEGIAGFSSRGPCGNESRIKPDVVAPGTDIASTKSSAAPATNFWGPYPKNRQYALMGGTSMAAPIVSGFAALVRQYLRTAKGYGEPSAALMKAVIINSTRQLGGADALADHDYIPNFHQGFGCIDLRNVVPSKNQKDLQLQFLDSWKREELQFSSTGQRYLFRFHAAEGTPLRVCLCWTDPPGRGLQNNLNLMLLHVKTGQKWVGNEQLPRMITSFDRDNNVEIIRLDDPFEGEYRMAVQATNLLVGAQDFAVVVTGNLKEELQQLK